VKGIDKATRLTGAVKTNAGAAWGNRDEHIIVFNDKFGVSDVHIDVIPTWVVEDITHLTKDDIPMVKRTCRTDPTFPIASRIVSHQIQKC
jgi:hypothetical protein